MKIDREFFHWGATADTGNHMARRLETEISTASGTIGIFSARPSEERI